MNASFVIWTMQRTGGTTLSTILEEISGKMRIQHEPFNQDRVFGSVATRWHQRSEYRLLIDEMRSCLSEKPIIKHCYEVHNIDRSIDRALLQVTSEYGYLHVHLDRINELNRLLSRELAEATGAWDKQQAKDVYLDILAGRKSLPKIDIAGCIAHFKHCRKRRAELEELFSETGTAVMRVEFEQFYTSPSEGRANFDRLAKYLGLGNIQLKAEDARITEFLTRKSQKSADLYNYFPNYEEARRTLTCVLAAAQATESALKT